ncbi:hypothetical protein [Bradyrhizobium sp. BR 1432]
MNTAMQTMPLPKIMGGMTNPMTCGGMMPMDLSMMGMPMMMGCSGMMM